MSPRAVRALKEADIIACEDTRRTRKLLTHHGIEARRLVTYHEANERRSARELVKHIESGASVVLVSDAGTPGLSDPGYRLVGSCIERGIDVSIVPGPNAAIGALAISGLPPGRFVFEGFLPRRSSERKRRLEVLVAEDRTLVFYESPHRVAATLADMAEVLGPRPAALVRELTKMYEEVLRATLPELAEAVMAKPPRGEIVLVVGGAVRGHADEVGPDELAHRARELMAAGTERREAMARVAREAGVSRRKVFDALLEGDGTD